jgi:hypothetical protein
LNFVSILRSAFTKYGGWWCIYILCFHDGEFQSVMHVVICLQVYFEMMIVIEEYLEMFRPCDYLAQTHARLRLQIMLIAVKVMLHGAVPKCWVAPALIGIHLFQMKILP